MPEPFDLAAIKSRARLRRSHDDTRWMASVELSCDDWEAILSELARLRGALVQPKPLDLERARAILYGPIRQLGPDLEARAVGQDLLAEAERQRRVIEACTRKPGRGDLPANLIAAEYLIEGKVPLQPLGAYSVPSSPDEEV
jgi:hypothetical protein